MAGATSALAPQVQHRTPRRQADGQLTLRCSGDALIPTALGHMDVKRPNFCVTCVACMKGDIRDKCDQTCLSELQTGGPAQQAKHFFYHTHYTTAD
mmetsp:Transcript_32384/g.52380  ORF Transcript_32384/g.52380 Transcript_32384/m.52380 type:complete len:96 (+) Transcript_32384:4185-4472(+)